MCILSLQAFQHQELEKLQESGDFLDDDILRDAEGFVTRKAAPVSRASQLWKGILSHSGLTIIRIDFLSGASISKFLMLTLEMTITPHSHLYQCLIFVQGL
jgi:hypothetical protein